MNMLIEMIGIVALAVIYGLAWHNQPARDTVIDRRNSKQAAHE